MNECVIEEIKMKNLEENYDIVVVGAGHAGCEAALAGARLGLNTIMFTVSAELFQRPGSAFPSCSG